MQLTLTALMSQLQVGRDGTVPLFNPFDWYMKSWHGKVIHGKCPSTRMYGNSSDNLCNQARYGYGIKKEVGLWYQKRKLLMFLRRVLAVSLGWKHLISYGLYNFKLKSKAVPLCLPSRRISLSLKYRVNDAIMRIISLDILEQVDLVNKYVEWPSPIVVMINMMEGSHVIHKYMSSLLSGIPNVAVYLGDIIISGSSNEENLEILQ
ncbi:hypothetical protein GJ496_011394 [Pomphorhynchus laevis]|nr:hypothetical protein GJ496_011394 [Pomphorhynchus laevis]